MNGSSITSDEMVMTKAFRRRADGENQGLVYEYENEKNSDGTYKSNSRTIGCWFKRVGTNNNRILTVFYSNNNSFNEAIEVLIVDNYVHVRTNSEVFINKDDLISTNTIKSIDWNYVSLTYTVNDEGISYVLNLNGVDTAQDHNYYNIDRSVEFIKFGDREEKLLDDDIIHTCLFFSKKAMTSDEVGEMYKYTYDYAGRLTKETDSAGKRREYTYDSHSNMTESVVKDSQNNVLDNKVYTYSTNFPHLLMSYTKNGEEVYIDYDMSLRMYPVRIYSEDSTIDYSLEWKNKELIKYTLDYTGNKYLSFKYNESGQRVKKTLTHTITGDKVHKYKYFGNKLIEEYKNVFWSYDEEFKWPTLDDEVKGETETLQFMYDESGLLYGFRYNGVEYYYLRDSLQTILGIIDVNKNVVCEYEYDAWGNHRVLDASRNENGNKYFIGNINPFRYKGYYYDVETTDLKSVF